MVKRAEEEKDARVEVSKAIKQISTTRNMIMTILGRRPDKGNPYHLSINSGFNIILEGITELRKNYGHVNSVLEVITPCYPKESRKNIDAKIGAAHAAIESLCEFEIILSNIKEGLNALPTKFFD